MARWSVVSASIAASSRGCCARAERRAPEAGRATQGAKLPYNPPAARLKARQHAAASWRFMRHIRNFSIIAHVDHGKSTLADRFIQLCGGLADREMQAQVLDSMALERERGITIKAQSVTLYYSARDGERYQLNMIDTPGHVDFSYEVSRSLAACDGALLVVDASQGVEAQSVANCYTATEQGLEVLPVINKIDLPSADADRVAREIEEIIGIQATDAARVSAKTGEGVPELLETLIRRIPAPRGSLDAPLQALIIDSWFDNYVGVVSLVRVMNGSLKSGDRIRVVSTGRSHLVDRLGRFTPKPVVERSEEHTSELQSQSKLVCRLLLEKKNRNIIAQSDKMQAVLALVKRVAPTNSTVLVGGASGVVKDLIPRGIHEHWQRVAGPSVKI